MEIFLLALLINIGFYSFVFIIGKIFKKHSLIDVFWGLSFVNLIWLLSISQNVSSISSFVLLILITVWGLRLSIHLARRNFKAPEDYRYEQIVHKLDSKLTFIPLFVKEYFYIYLLQAVLSYILSFGFIVYFVINQSTNIVFVIVGTLIVLHGFYYEFLADYQLDKFKALKKPGQVLNTGVWKSTRHPNYYGEIVIWYGIFVISLSSFVSVIGVISPLFINYLIVNISGVPLLEEKLKLRPEYASYIESTNKLIPWRKK